MVREVGLIGAAYLVGSIPTGLILARRKGVNIREVGSGNIGATNVTRNLGKALGAVTLVGDLLKGTIPVLVARRLDFGSPWIAAVAFAAFAGHVFPIYLKFQGGKGVATAFGVFLGIEPIAALIGAGVWLIAFALSRYASVSSLSAAVAFPVGVWWLTSDRYLVTASLLISLVIYVRHRENIQRLMDGTEGKFAKEKVSPCAGGPAEGK